MCSTAGLTDVVRKPVGRLSFLWHPNLRSVDINQWLESFLGCLNSATQEKGIPFLIYPASFIERTLTRFSFLKAVLNFLRAEKNSTESKPTSNVLSFNGCSNILFRAKHLLLEMCFCHQPVIGKILTQL